MPRLRLDLERARREGWQFGAKLERGTPYAHRLQPYAHRLQPQNARPQVRGAYMEHERARAAALGYG